jgi:hypothetical protein
MSCYAEHPLLTVPLLQINWLWGGISHTEPHHHREPCNAKQETNGECYLCSILPVQNKINIFTWVQGSQVSPFHTVYIYSLVLILPVMLFFSDCMEIKLVL